MMDTCCKRESKYEIIYKVAGEKETYGVCPECYKLQHFRNHIDSLNEVLRL